MYTRIEMPLTLSCLLAVRKGWRAWLFGPLKAQVIPEKANLGRRGCRKGLGGGTIFLSLTVIILQV